MLGHNPLHTDIHTDTIYLEYNLLNGMIIQWQRLFSSNHVSDGQTQILTVPKTLNNCTSNCKKGILFNL